MELVLLAIGTVFSIVFIALLLIGGASDHMISPLDSDAFPMKFLYSAGFALQNTSICRLRGQLGSKLRDDAALYYGKKYGEFYARAIWAQILSFDLVSISLMFVLGAVFPGEMGGFFALVGIILAVVCTYYFFTYTESKLKSRRDACEGELPNAISKLALLVNSGTTMHEAWRMVAYGKEGVFYDMMRRSCESMDNGKTEVDAIYELGVLSNSQNVKKFTSALIQSIEHGGGELPRFLENQSSELWGQHRQRLLQKGEQAAGALLMPIALMFVGIMLIILSAAMQSFSF